MQGIRRRDPEIEALFVSASKIANTFGRIGLTEPQDMVQETMLKILSKNDGRKASTAWMRVVLRNIAIDKMRKTSLQYKNTVSELDNDDDRRSILECNLPASYQPEVVNFDVMPRLKELLAKMSLPLQQVLTLYADGYSYEEIASMTKVSIGTVRSRLFYARRKARYLFREFK